MGLLASDQLYNPKMFLLPTRSKNWENQQRYTSKVNNMDELDKRLENLALAAKQHPPGSKSRRLALTRLISEVEKSRKLFCKRKYDFPKELYNEALQETWLYICQHIENCDPQKGKIITWINFILDKRFTNSINRYLKSLQEKSLDEPIQNSNLDGESGKRLLDTIEQSPVPNQPSDWEKVRIFLEEDSTGQFKQKFIENNPQANFQAIAIRRLDGESWKDISNSLKIPLPTLSTFYQRCVKHFTPLFQKYLE